MAKIINFSDHFRREQSENKLRRIKQQLGQFSDKPKKPKEVNGPKGLEPTRYGDWERKGICYDF